jgi:hypothetical protein
MWGVFCVVDKEQRRAWRVVDGRNILCQENAAGYGQVRVHVCILVCNTHHYFERETV